jgi:dolichol phosphate-mannose biosynthesis regulatory protein
MVRWMLQRVQENAETDVGGGRWRGQANLSDRAVGLLFLVVSTVVFVYYTTWVLVLVRGGTPEAVWLLLTRSSFVLQPFVDEDKGIHNYFPPYHYAVLIPAVLLVVGVAGVLSFLALVMINSGAGKKQR